MSKTQSMSKIGLVIVFILMAGRNYAQQDYFVLIQADNNQPFYARLEGENKSISSSVQGHMILSQLKDGSYTITIGFPKKLFPELQFSFVLHKKDLDLQLKDLGDKGWGLFNPQTLELKMPDEKKGEGAQRHLEGVKKDDAFSRLMAGVVSDTAVMYNTYAMEATLKDSPATPKSAPVDTLLSAAQETASTGLKSANDLSSGGKSSGDKSSGEKPPGLKVDSSDNGMLISATSGKDTSGTVAVVNAPVGIDISKDAIRPDTSFSNKELDSSKLSSGQIKDSIGQESAVRRRGLPKTGDPSIIMDSSVRKTDSSVIPGSALSGTAAVPPGSTAVLPGSPGTAIPGSSPDSAAGGNAMPGTISSSTNSGSALPGSSPASPIPGTTSVILPGASSSVPSSLAKAGPVLKLSERKTTKGLRLVYADHIKGKKADTIVVIIPVDTGARLAQRPGESNSLAASPVRSDSPALVSARPDHPATSPNGTGTSGQKTTVSAPLFRPLDTSQKKTPAKTLFINSDCRNFATDYDVDKLRVKMLETSKDEDRITAAHKVFKTKCFATKQIRALSEVFTSDAQKFRFFETAYPFVSDDHFKELTDLLADPVYNSKFRSMTGQQ